MDVWLASPNEIAPRREWLSADERARAERFLVPHAREEFVAARTLLRGELGRMLGADPAALRFSFGEHGRPVLDPPRELDFNLTHTRGLVGCAIGPGGFGIDLESALRPTDVTAVARKVFTPTEQAQLASHANPRSYFFSVWTVKEAYIKARGLGFALPPHQIEVTLEPTPRLHSVADSDPWRVAQFLPTVDHVCAVVIRSAEPVPCRVHAFGHNSEVIAQ